MQIFYRTFTGACKTVTVPPSETVATLKLRIQSKEGFTLDENDTYLTHNGRGLYEDNRTLDQYNIREESTLQLQGRLLGGKGGFGALLRSGGRTSLVDNFDACRDLSGRRLRHVNADQKLAEWAAEARERELEKLALKHIKEQEKAAAREARAQVEIDDVILLRTEALKGVQSAVQDALGRPPAAAAAKRSGRGEAAASSQPTAKRPRFMGAAADFDSEADSDSDADELDAAPAAGPSFAQAGPASAVGSAGGATGSGRQGSGGDTQAAALGSSPAPEGDSDSGSAAAKGVAARPRPDVASSATVNHAGSDNTTGATLERGTSYTYPPASAAAPPPQIGSSAAAAPQIGSQASATAMATATGDLRADGALDTTAAVMVVAAAVPVAEAAGGLIQLREYASAAELEGLGMERLKAELAARGLKGGGTLAERAARLFLLKVTPLDQIDRKHLAKLPKGK